MWLTWFGLVGCGHATRDARAVVTELCKWGQLSELQPQALPPELDLKVRVRDADLRYASGEVLAPSTENPFLALHQTVGLVVDGPTLALSRAVAENAKCEVTVSWTGDVATAHVKREAPRPLDGQDLYVKVGELQKLATLDEQVARIQEWIAAAPSVQTTEYDLKVEQQGDRWMVNFGLPESRIAADQATLDQANATITEGRAGEAVMAKLVILGTKYFVHASSSQNSGPRVDITVRNDTDGRIAKVQLHGVLTSPDHEGPWFDEELTHVPLGRFEPGDEETWTIVSRLPGKWKARPTGESTLTIEPLKMWGPGDKLLADKTALEDALQTAEQMTAEIARLQATYLTSAPVEPTR